MHYAAHVQAIKAAEQDAATVTQPSLQHAEVRQVFNIAQVYEMKDKVSLLTFDADDTIYEHGMDLDAGSWIVNALCALMECGETVSQSASLVKTNKYSSPPILLIRKKIMLPLCAHFLFLFATRTKACRSYVCVLLCSFCCL
jgi:hypothetical protein